MPKTTVTVSTTVTVTNSTKNLSDYNKFVKKSIAHQSAKSPQDMMKTAASNWNKKKSK